MDNETFQLFGRLNLNEIEDIDENYYFYSSFDAWEIVMKIFEEGVIAAAILSSIILIYMIAKFDFLRTRINIYILHCCVGSLAFNICIPLFELSVSLGVYHIANVPTICLIFGGNALFLALTLFFSTALAIDWLIVMLRPSWFEKYDRVQIYVVIIIYVLHGIWYVLHGIDCFSPKRIFSSDNILFEYFALLAIVLAINCYTYFRKLRDEDMLKYKYSLKVGTMTMLPWLPLLVYFFINAVLRVYRHHIVYRILDSLLLNLSKLVLLGMPIIIASSLDVMNDDFKKGFNMVFRRSSDYRQDKLNEVEENEIQNEMQRNSSSSNLIC